MTFQGHVTSSITWRFDSPYALSYWCSIGTKLLGYLQTFSRYSTPNISGSRPWPSGVTWRHRACDHLTPHIAFPMGDPLYPTLYLQPFTRLGSKHIGVTTLTFQGHVTSSITWRFDSPYRVSYRCSIGTKSLSPSVFEIFGFKYIGVTTLTFWGHVTSLVMWPFEGPI